MLFSAHLAQELANPSCSSAGDPAGGTQGVQRHRHRASQLGQHSPGTQHLPRASPPGEHAQSCGSRYLFNVSDFQLFAGTKKFMATSPVNTLMTPAREGSQSKYIARAAPGWASGAAPEPLALFFHSFCVSPLQLSATWHLTRMGMGRVASANTHISKTHSAQPPCPSLYK